MNNILKFGFFPVYLVSKSYNTGNIFYSLLFVLLSLFVLFVFLSVLKNNYFKVISRSHSFHSSSNYKLGKIEGRSIKKALINKEIKKYFSSAIYVFNTAFGPLLMLIASVGSLFFSFDKLLKLADIGENINPFTMVFGLCVFAISLSNITASSISIERENFWILKMIPVNTKTIFSAKRFVNEIVVIPAAILSLLIFRISSYINNLELLLLIVLFVIYTVLVSNWGLIVNLMLPKLDATSDTIIVKQSAASFVSIFSGLLLVIIYIGLLLGLKLSNVLILLISIILSTIILIVLNIILNTWGIKKFKQIN